MHTTWWGPIQEEGGGSKVLNGLDLCVELQVHQIILTTVALRFDSFKRHAFLTDLIQETILFRLVYNPWDHSYHIVDDRLRRIIAGPTWPKMAGAHGGCSLKENY